MNYSPNQDEELAVEIINPEVRIAVAYLFKIAQKLGINDEIELEGTQETAETSNLTVRKFAQEVYKVWASLYQNEHNDFIKSTEFDLTYERPVKEAIKGGGYSPIAFPMRLERMFGIFMPAVKIQDKRFWIPLLRSIPELRRSNYLK